MPGVDCGHDAPAVIRTYNSGNDQKSNFSLCKVCKEKPCFIEFVIREIKN